MTYELDNQESLNPEGEPDTTPETESDEELTKTKEAYENQKIRAEKAERELKDLKAKLETDTPKKSESETPKNEEKQPDYNDRIDRLILKSENITHPDDQDLVMKEAKRLNLSVEEIVKEDYIKAKLKTLATQREAEAGMPTGSGKSAGSTKNTVEYWRDRKNPDGTYQTPDDLELAEKVIDARTKQIAKGQMFSDELY